MTIQRMRFACWITTAANTHSEYVIHIGFPLQQLLHERASMLCYTFIAFRVVRMLCLYGLLGRTSQLDVRLLSQHVNK